MNRLATNIVSSKHSGIAILLAVASVGLSACQFGVNSNSWGSDAHSPQQYATAQTSSAQKTHNTTHTNTRHSTTVNPTLVKNSSLSQQAQFIQQRLAAQDYSAVIDSIHPTRGVRFSMYAYIDTSKDKVFSRNDFSKYLTQDRTKFTWGNLDGVGDPLIIPLPEYLDDWVQASRFNDASISINEFIGSGNSLNNLSDSYPNADFVEFYHTGDPQFEGMDWRALRLVFEEYEGRRYLVAIITDEWTI